MLERRTEEVKIAENLMIAMKFHVTNGGFRYIEECVRLVTSDPSLLHAMTKELYPRIAGKYNVTANSVARCIKHAVRRAWQDGEQDMRRIFHRYLSSDQNKPPTNTQFLTFLLMTIRERQEQENHNDSNSEQLSWDFL